MSAFWFLLALALGLSLYFWIGPIFEERKLVREFGDACRARQARAPRPFPSPRPRPHRLGATDILPRRPHIVRAWSAYHDPAGKMPPSLGNAHLRFRLEPATGAWWLEPAVGNGPRLEAVRLGGQFYFTDGAEDRGRGRPWTWDGALAGSAVGQARVESPHGPMEQLSLAAGGPNGLRLELTFALPADRPFLLSRLRVINGGPLWLRVAHLDLARIGPAYDSAGQIHLAQDSRRLTFFANGWQSWSFTGALAAGRTQPHTRLGPIQGPPNHNPATPYARRRGHFSSDMFAILADPAGQRALLAGFLSQREQFGSVDVRLNTDPLGLRLRAQCDDVLVPPGQSLRTDWACFQLLPAYDDDPLREYAEAAGRENRARIPQHIPAGWCSWYYYFNRVSAADVRANLSRLASDLRRLPLEIVQLDDGFQENVGDWFQTNARFPEGLAPLAGEIRERGLTPGLWLAPFIARPDSRLRRTHPDWLLRRNGRLVNAGYVFDTFCHGLDLTHPDVQDHTRQLIRAAVREWGFPYLKLDFLYAAALPGQRHDPTRTRAQTMRLGLEIIRQAAGEETFLLGCGCPLGSAIGLVDGMRIGADVAPRWEPAYWGMTAPFRDEPAMPATRNAIRNVLTRAPLHRRWWLNDPDCLLVRRTARLTQAEIQSLATVIALSGGMFFVSDDLTALGPAERDVAAVLLPVLGQVARVRDWLEKDLPEQLELPLSGPAGRWSVWAVFNWGEVPATRTLPLPQGGDHHVYDFWHQTYHRASGALGLADLPPHGGRLLAVRPADGAGPQYVGSSLHFSQGAEVSRWQVGDRRLTFEVSLGRLAEGHVVLALPAPPATPAEAQPVARGVYRLPVRVAGTAEIRLDW